MKISTILFFIKRDLKSLAPVAPFIVLVLIQFVFQARAPLVYHLQFPVEYILVLGVILVAYHRLFGTSRVLSASSKQQSPSLEFVLGKAVGRKQMFFVKTGIYFFVFLTPLLAILAYSLVKPSIIITFPSAVVDPSARFYQTHFAGVIVNASSTSDSRLLTLPTGRFDVAIFGILFCTACAVVLQALHFLLRGQRILGLVIPTAFIVSAPLALGFGVHPNAYERLVALSAEKPLLSFATMGVLIGVVEITCSRYFETVEALD